ncbi:MAG: helix-turn-helix transcriptional regulator [Marinicaulis sp.]|nr:helix-turn-helix transcriptional regulator [Marinicaulis sp.]
MTRTYNQDCILAHALDLLGERWTFLILRDLFLGPQRFGDLQAALPGIGANLLSKRLKELEEAGLLEGPSPSDGRVRYRLTKEGEGLRPAVRMLMKWSIQYFMDRPGSSPAHDCIYSNDLQPDSVALAIELFANHCPAPNSNYVAHVIIDGFSYTIYQMNGEMTCHRGADAPAVATLTSDVATIMQAFRYELTMEEVKSRMTLSGDQKALDHLLDCIVHTKGEEDQSQAQVMQAAF